MNDEIVNDDGNPMGVVNDAKCLVWEKNEVLTMFPDYSLMPSVSPHF